MLKNLKSFLYLFCLIIAIFAIDFLLLPQEEIIQNIIISEDYKVKEGDTFLKILTSYKVTANDAQQLIESTTKIFDLTKLKIGQNIQLRYIAKEESKILDSLTIPIDNQRRIEITREENGLFKASDIIINFNKDIYKITGQISGSIMQSGLKAGVPSKNLSELINIYSHQIDFQRDLKEGDQFTILIEKFTSADKLHSYYGKTIYACLEVKNKKYNIYRFKLDDGNEDFFDEEQKSVRRSLLRTPVMSSKISSKFGPRKHPVLGYTLMHKGVDFAAPIGTPIYSAGNGIILEAGHKGSYGKYIKIKHTKEIATAYAHIKSFAKGIEKGSKVKQGQIIALVGNTGSCTGPHLHYEVISNGTRINPLLFKTIPARKLMGHEKMMFIKFKKDIDWSIANSSSPYLTSNLKHYIL